MAFRDSRISEIEQLVQRTIARDEIFLVDVELKGSDGNPVLSVYLESDQGGIKLDDCAEISRLLQTVIEANELLGERFTLNVSSPGLSRPLKIKRQYVVNKGRLARVRLRSGEQTQIVEGILKEINEDDFLIDQNGKTVLVRFDHVIETKIVPVV